ncbi:MAG TPA: response regulator transcription factor [Pseudonocardiaceae bacterium]|nr:response regulator transcription factor [Pseudonocardiaceae bacterium]
MGRSDQSVRVVLADDEKVILDGLSAVLESDPRIRIVGRAADGAALLHMVGQLAPDVALLDVRIPGLQGLSALRRLRPDPPPYCALLTTFDLDEYVDAGLEAGAHGFLLKDSPPDALVRAVHDLQCQGVEATRQAFVSL